MRNTMSWMGHTEGVQANTVGRVLSPAAPQGRTPRARRALAKRRPPGAGGRTAGAPASTVEVQLEVRRKALRYADGDRKNAGQIGQFG